MTNSHQPEDIAAYNESSLKALVRAIRLSQGQFRLILVRCNYGALRDRMVQRLRELSPIEIRELVLPKSVKTLYTTIKAQLDDDVPQALMVFGLESVSDINAVLKSSNTIREEFSKNFPFPLVLWINDEVLQKLLRIAPDLESWATSVEFKLTTDELLDFLRQTTDELFGSDSTINLEDCFELDADWKDLQRWGQGLEPDLEARLEFVRGLDDFRRDRIEQALAHYQKSLTLPNLGLERQGILLLNIARCYYRKAELNRAESRQCWEESRNYFQQCLDVFEQAQRPDLVAKHISQLGEVLRRLKAWDELNFLAEKSLTLHQNYGFARQLAQDYGFLAEVALEESGWKDANQLTQEALQLLSTIPNRKPSDWALCTFLLARSQQHLGQIKEAIANLEQVRQNCNPQYDPQLYIDSLGELRSLYFQQGEYREAFQIKQEQFQIEHQYGFRAFIGAGYLQPKRSSVNPAVGEVEQQGTIAQEIAVSSREQDVKRLIGRISRNDCKLTVIHGQSGVGKSSILQGGLVPALHQQAIGERDVLPVLLRVYNDWVGALEMVLANAEFSPPNPPILGGTGAQSPSTLGGTGVQSPPTLGGTGAQSPLTLGGTGVQSPPELGDLGGEEGQERIGSALHSLGLPPQPSSLKLRLLRGEQGERFEPASHSRCDPPQPPLIRGENSVKVPLFKGDLGGSLSAPILEQLRNNAENNLLTVLIFDQFEEFFFVYSDQAKRRPFYEFLRDCLDIPFVKVILSLREDYLHYLLELDRLFDLTVINNNILDKGIRYYLGNFSPEDARSVVQSLTRNSQFPLETGLIEAFVQDLAGEVGEVRPIELQVVGAQLQADNITTLEDYQQYGSKEKLVEKWLEAVIQDCGTQNEQTARFVLYFLTDNKDTRPLKTRAELVKDLEATDFASKIEKLELVLQILVGSGLVLKIPDTPANRYQLVHDYLVSFIRQSQQAREVAERKKDKEQQQLLKAELNQTLKQQLSTEEKLNRVLTQSLRKARLVGVALFTLTLIAGGLGLRAAIGETNAQLSDLSASSDVLVASNRPFDALLKSLRAGRQLKHSLGVTAYTQTRVVTALQQAIYAVRERNCLEGHTDWVTSVSFSSNGQILASASQDGTVKLWDLDAKEIKTLKHGSSVQSISFTPDGKVLASASRDKTIKLWRIDGILLQTLKGHTSSVESVSFSPDGKVLASASADKTIKLWGSDGTLLKTLQGHSQGVTSVSFSPDSKTLVSGSQDGTMKLWRSNGTLVKTLKEDSERGVDGVNSVSFSPNGQMIASASMGKVSLWREDGTLLKTIQMHREGNMSWAVVGLSFSPDSKTFASASSDNTVRLWNLDGKELQTLRGHGNLVKSVNFSPDGKTIASASWDNTVRLWNRDGILPTILKGHDSLVFEVKFSPDGQMIASGGGVDHTVKLWSRNGRLLQTLKGHRDSIETISFSPDSQTIVSASWDKTVKLWSRDGKLLKTLTMAHKDRVTSVNFSPDGKMFASTSKDETVKLWRSDGTLIRTLREFSTGVAFSPDGKTIAWANEDGIVKLGSYEGTEIRTLKMYSPPAIDVTFSPDGQMIALAFQSGIIKLLSLNGRELTTFKGHERAVQSISFSPDGKTLASSGYDKTVRLWSLDGRELKALKGSRDTVYSVSFSSDGKTLASTGADGTVILWNLDLNDLLRRGCNWVRDYLKTNPNVSESDRTLCDDISTQK